VLSVICAARRFKPIEAQVIRRTERGLGIEWKELTAASLSQLVDGGQLAAPVPETPARIQR
jgi:uncharacterized tellurite resistance protein B-like protein